MYFMWRYKPNQRGLQQIIPTRNRVAEQQDDHCAMRTPSSFANSLQAAAWSNETSP